MPLPTIPEYSTSIKTPALVHPTILQGGHPIEKGVRLIKYAGGFCVVFPFQTPTKKYAVRCWHAEVANAKKRTQLIAEAIHQSGLPYFVGFEFHQDGIMTPQGIQPLVVMDWVDAQPLKKYLIEHLNESNTLNEVAANFMQMAKDLHANNFSHGDLQHGNVMVRQDKSLVLVDYDSMYVPSLQGYEDDIKGLVGYQHPARWKCKEATPKADYFSELVIYLTLKALAKHPNLWNDLQMEDTETLLFNADDIESKGTSEIFSRLRKDEELQPLVEKLCEFLQKPSIEDLEPLENATISKVDSIADKWKRGNGYIPTPQKGKVEDPDNITAKWGGGNGYVAPKKQDSEELIQNISSKFKRPE